jgi:DNA-binding protein Fis
MSEERAKVRCRSCELVQWSDQETNQATNCRRCGEPLPAPVITVVERIVEKTVVRQDPRCLECLERACQLISAATRQMTQPYLIRTVPEALGGMLEGEVFPTMAEMERAMLLAAYERSERKPLIAAQLLGIGKTTFYRKLKEMAAAPVVKAAPMRLAA